MVLYLQHLVFRYFNINLLKFASKTGFLKLQKLSVQQQCNNGDCGLFGIANMVEIYYENNPEDLSYDQDAMRNHLEECFSSKEMC